MRCLYVKEGCYTVTLDDTRYEIAEGDLILFCSGAIHYVLTGDSEQSSYYDQMYNFFCKPLRYSFVIMRALQKNTNILAKTKYFHAYTTQ